MVAGERLETLCEALREMRLKRSRDGTFRVSRSLEARIGDPFIRAVGRVEAELMLHDANHIGSPGAIERTYEQRAAGARATRPAALSKLIATRARGRQLAAT